MAEVRIKPDTYQYPDLISKIEQGLVKLPAFQRDFVWSMDKTLFLLDSIARRYPIGTFLFWQTSEFINALRNIGDLELASPPDGHPVQYVLDGQQRITSLYAAIRSATIDGDTYRISADLDSTVTSEEIFSEEKPDNERWVLLSDLLGDDYGYLFAKLSPVRQRRFNDLRTTFLNYPFSVTLVEGGDLDIVCDLFERINNTGVELSVFDLLVARTWSPPDDGGGFDLRQEFEELKGELAEVGFEHIPEPVVGQLAGAIVKNDCTRKAILKIDRQEMRAAWGPLAEGLRGAVDFARKKLRVTASRLLPYPSLLVPMAYFMVQNNQRNPDGLQSAWLSRYFYLNGFSGRLSSGTQSKLTEDLKLIRRLTQEHFPRFTIPVGVEPADVQEAQLRVGSAYCKSLLCLLAAQRPLDLRDGGEVMLHNRALKKANSRHFHHIFPKAYVRGKPGAEEVNSVANIALVPADLNLRIGAKAPSKYLSKYARENDAWDRTLRSHMIKGRTRTAMEEDDFSRFLRERAKLLSELAQASISIE